MPDRVVHARRRALLRAGLSWPLALPALALGDAAGPHRIRLAGPASTVSFPLLRLVQTQPLSGTAFQFTLWRDPDQLRALAVGGSADFLAMPSNVAANLYNRGIDLVLLNVAAWGMLAVVSREAGLRTLSDLKGKEIAMPFRADMPDVLFQLLARAQGLDSRRDLRLRYVATPMDAAQLLLTRRVDHALLAEPAVSMVLRKGRRFPMKVVAPDLHRSIDLQQEWGRVLNRPPRVPQAGIAAMGSMRQDPGLLRRFTQAYAEAEQWCRTHPDDCGALAAEHIPMLQADAVADALRAATGDVASAAQARPELEFFFEQLLPWQPQLLGGKLPDAGFYAEA